MNYISKKQCPVKRKKSPKSVSLNSIVLYRITSSYAACQLTVRIAPTKDEFPTFQNLRQIHVAKVHATNMAPILRFHFPENKSENLHQPTCIVSTTIDNDVMLLIKDLYMNSSWFCVMSSSSVEGGFFFLRRLSASSHSENESESFAVPKH